MLFIVNDLYDFQISGAGRKGNQKMKDDPTMLLKIKEKWIDVLDDPTMLMKTNNLIYEATMCIKAKGLSKNQD